MTYACAIHQCRDKQERRRAFRVDCTLSYLNVKDEADFTTRLRSALQEHLPGAELQPLHSSRYDVIVDGRTVMSWTPRMN